MSRINTNVAAMNAQRNIGLTDVAFQRTVGRLSSGFRINRAADDAAGLGIANRFRADIRALEQASANATQANSLLQVAEGATNQISGIVDRMKELASQAASDNVNQDGRALIQAEFTQLEQEITRIVETTNFQGTQLLAGASFDAGANVSLSGEDGESGFLGDLNGIENLTATVSGAPTAAGVFELWAGFTPSGGAEDEGSTGALTIRLGGEDGDILATIETAAQVGDGAGDAVTGFASGASGSFQVNGLTINLAFTGTVAGSDLADAISGEELSFTADEAMNSLQFMVSISGNATAEEGLAADFVELSFLNLNLAQLGADGDGANSLQIFTGGTESLTRNEWAGVVERTDRAITQINAASGRSVPPRTAWTSPRPTWPRPWRTSPPPSPSSGTRTSPLKRPSSHGCRSCSRPRSPCSPRRTWHHRASCS